MLKVSKDAARILRLPFVHHPSFTTLTQDLAADPTMTFSRAVDVLCAEMPVRGVTQLDLEMCQPGVTSSLPFVSVPRSAEDGFQQAVSDHVAQMVGAMK